MRPIVRAIGPADIEVARALFVEYAESLGIDLGFQDFDRELASLPGEYSPPRGGLLLAVDGDAVLGCVAVRPLEWPGVAELKRLYVRPSARGHGLGLLLTQAAIAAAREADYESLRLDTLPTMGPAQRLYRSLGFCAIEPYRFNPVPGTSYWELRLQSGPQRCLTNVPTSHVQVARYHGGRGRAGYASQRSV